ncbi:MAG: HAD-IB family hydrolase [Flavitalea sp.]
MSGAIAFFDFDGTITTKDSFLEFIKYCKGNIAFYTGFASHAPILIAYKLKIVSNQRAKEVMLKHFFGKMQEEKFAEYCSRFSNEVLPGLMRPKALAEIKKMQDAGGEVVIVSASPENWLIPICRHLSAKCIATKLVISEKKITGKINGLNCYGEEKVRRIHEQFELKKYSSVYCYGDTPGDRPMLALGSIRFYKPFR